MVTYRVSHEILDKLGAGGMGEGSRSGTLPLLNPDCDLTLPEPLESIELDQILHMLRTDCGASTPV